MTKKKAAAKKPAKKSAKSVARKAVKPAAAKSSKNAAEIGVPKKPVVSAVTSAQAIYLYGITDAPERPFAIKAEAVDGQGAVEAVPYQSFLCWISRVNRFEFAENLQKNIENLEWLAAASIRHQKVLSELANATAVLPARFGTVYLTVDSLVSGMKSNQQTLRSSLDRVSNADEWGVKVFRVESARPVAVSAASGVDYLRQKAATMHSSGRAHDSAVDELAEALAKLSAASTAGGKASAGQPGLVWSGSFLVKRSRKKDFDAVLRRFAQKWADERRIDVSGPWPPYSFVTI